MHIDTGLTGYSSAGEPPELKRLLYFFLAVQNHLLASLNRDFPDFGFFTFSLFLF